MFTVLTRLRVQTPLTSGFSNKYLKSNFYYALVFVFNRVSQRRIEEVGPNRACAEWLMRNGALIKWKNRSTYVTHYNSLPLDKDEKGDYLLKEVDATDSGISYHGFPHFDGCKFVDTVKLVKCAYVDDRALNLLNYLKGSLQYLEVDDCKEVTEEGLVPLGGLSNLQTLKLGKVKWAKNKDNIIHSLKKSLPHCEITVK